MAASGVPNPSSAARPTRSSPSTWATLTSRPSRSASARTASASPAGFSPPALATIRTPRSSAGAKALLELGQERLGIAAFGRLGAVAGEDQHGQLGEVVAGQVVEVAAGEHLAHRGEPVAVEARAVADADRVHHVGPPIQRRQPQPTGRLVATGGTASRPSRSCDLGALTVAERALARRTRLFWRLRRLTGYPEVQLPTPGLPAARTSVPLKRRSSIMAVPKRRMSRSNTRSRRAQWKAKAPNSSA